MERLQIKPMTGKRRWLMNSEGHESRVCFMLVSRVSVADNDTVALRDAFVLTIKMLIVCAAGT